MITGFAIDVIQRVQRKTRNLLPVATRKAVLCPLSLLSHSHTEIDLNQSFRKLSLLDFENFDGSIAPHIYPLGSIEGARSLHDYYQNDLN